MQIHPEEVRWAQAYEKQYPFDSLTREQIHSIMVRGRELHQWFKTHPLTHCYINLAVFVFLFIAGFLILFRLPGLFLTPDGANSIPAQLAAGAVSGALNCWLMYSVGVFTIHEGAAHQMIFPPRGPVSRIGNWIAINLSRFAGGDPIYYAERHMIHHAKFGTEQDAEFLNFVTPGRYWRTFLPFAVSLNFSDFIIHRPLGYTTSRFITQICALALQGALAVVMYRQWGLIFTVVVMLFLTHASFYLDRLRQFTEHNLMPLDNLNGSRSFGFGFWGMLIGGGPWGTPCHWEHHLVASIPWYQQLILHRHVVALLTPRQREQFLLRPFTGFPRLYLRLIRESYAFMKSAGAR